MSAHADIQYTHQGQTFAWLVWYAASTMTTANISGMCIHHLSLAPCCSHVLRLDLLLCENPLLRHPLQTKLETVNGQMTAVMSSFPDTFSCVPFHPFATRPPLQQQPNGRFKQKKWKIGLEIPSSVGSLAMRQRRGLLCPPCLREVYTNVITSCCFGSLQRGIVKVILKGMDPSDTVPFLLFALAQLLCVFYNDIHAGCTLSVSVLKRAL